MKVRGVTGRDRESRKNERGEGRGGEGWAGTEGSRRGRCVARPLGLSPTGNMFSSALSNTETTGHVATEHFNGGLCNPGSGFQAPFNSLTLNSHVWRGATHLPRCRVDGVLQ